MSVKDRECESIDALEFSVAESILDGVVGIELEGFDKWVVVLVRVGAHEVLSD